MALFKKAIIDEVEWNPQSDDVYAWKSPSHNLTTFTQLVVHENQEALLFSKGQLLGKFGPGKHTLNTENLPILNRLYGIPFGGRNPFTAEVWFVQKKQIARNWSCGVTIHDPDYDTQIPLNISSNQIIAIDDSEKFLLELVGTKETFTNIDLDNQVKGEWVTKTVSVVNRTIIESNIGFKKITAYLDILSERLTAEQKDFWKSQGLELRKFSLVHIDIDESTAYGQKVKQAITDQSTQRITGHTWQQEQLFNTAQDAVSGMGKGSGGMLGGILAMNMLGGGGGMGMGMGAGAMAPNYNQPSFSGTPSSNIPQSPNQQVKMVYCAKCGKKYSSMNEFCPNCGHHYNPCPKCAADNDENAKRCVSCGTVLMQAKKTCPQCGAPINADSAFCCNCGSAIAPKPNVCPNCGQGLPMGSKFCPKCGTKC